MMEIDETHLLPHRDRPSLICFRFVFSVQCLPLTAIHIDSGHCLQPSACGERQLLTLHISSLGVSQVLDPGRMVLYARNDGRWGVQPHPGHAIYED